MLFIQTERNATEILVEISAFRRCQNCQAQFWKDVSETVHLHLKVLECEYFIQWKKNVYSYYCD